MMAFMLTLVLPEFLEHHCPEATPAFMPKFDRLKERVEQVILLHDNYRDQLLADT